MMKRRKEFIGVRTIEAANVNGYGKHLYNMYMTDTDIIRCRDCGRSRENGWKCTYWVTGRWDEEQEADVIELADVRPDGFCFKAEKRDA